MEQRRRPKAHPTRRGCRGQQLRRQPGIQEREPSPGVHELNLGREHLGRRLRLHRLEVRDEALVPAAQILEVPGSGDQVAHLADGAAAGNERRGLAQQAELGEHPARPASQHAEAGPGQSGPQLVSKLALVFRHGNEQQQPLVRTRCGGSGAEAVDALGAPSSSGRRPAAPGPPADPVVATAAIAAASPLRSLLLRSRRSISTRCRPRAAAPVPPRTRSGGTMLDGLALVDAHLHAARLPTLKVSMPEWAPFPAVPMDELYSADGTLRPAAFDDHLAVQGVDVALLLAEYSPRVTGLQTVEDLLPVIEHNPARFRLVGNINPYFHHPVDEEVARQTAYAGYIARSLAGKRPCTGCTLSATAPSSACRATSSSTGWWKYGLILPTSRNRAGLYSITGSRSSTVCRPVTRGLYSAISSATSTPWTARWSSNAAGRSVPSAE